MGKTKAKWLHLDSNFFDAGSTTNLSLNSGSILNISSSYASTTKLLPVTDIDIASKKYVDDLIGGSGDIIDLAFKSAYSTYYTEYVYTSGDLTQVNIWETSGKTTKLFTKDLVYTSGNLTSVTITDEISSDTLTKTLVYDGSGDLITVDRVYA
jgi:hypothetical protein